MNKSIVIFYYQPQPNGLNVGRFQHLDRITDTYDSLILKFEEKLLRKDETLPRETIQHYIVIQEKGE